MPDRDEFTRIRATDCNFRDSLVRAALSGDMSAVLAEVRAWMIVRSPMVIPHLPATQVAFDAALAAMATGALPFAAALTAKRAVTDASDSPSRDDIVAGRAVQHALLDGAKSTAELFGCVFGEFAAHYVIHAEGGARDTLAAKPRSDTCAVVAAVEKVVREAAVQVSREGIDTLVRLGSARASRVRREQIGATTDVLAVFQ